MNPNDRTTMIEDRVRLVDGEGKALAARVGKVEGVLARICPEADSQTDGKGRTLVQINARLEDFYRWRKVAHTAIQATQDKVDDHAARLTKLERLIAAQVTVPAKVNVRSDAASTNEAMTDADTAYHGNLADIADAVPSTYRVGDDLAAWVRDLAAAHDLGVKAQAELRQRITELERSEGDLAVDNAGWMRDAEKLRTQLAAAQAATVAAEGRAATAKRHAADAEAKLSALRADIENVRASLGK